MVATQKLIELTDELMEQIVLTFYPESDLYKDVDGKLRVKKRYGEVRTRIYDILNNDLNGGRSETLHDRKQTTSNTARG